MAHHYPIVITRIPENMSKVNTETKYRWDLKNADWEGFRKQVEEELPITYTKKSTMKLEKILRKTITAAAEKHIGKKVNMIDGKPGYSKKVREEIEKRNRLKGRVREPGGRARWRDKCREVKKLIKEEKQNNWKEYVEGLDTKTNCKQVWKTIRNLDGRVSQRKENEMLVVEGKATSETKTRLNNLQRPIRKYRRSHGDPEIGSLRDKTGSF